MIFQIVDLYQINGNANLENHAQLFDGISKSNTYSSRTGVVPVPTRTQSKEVTLSPSQVGGVKY